MKRLCIPAHFKDYIALFPATYFEGTVLRQDIRNPCLIDDQALKEGVLVEGSLPTCKNYTYPKPKASSVGPDQIFYDKDGTRTVAPPSTEPRVLDSFGQTASLQEPTVCYYTALFRRNPNSTKFKRYYAEIPIEKPGNYVVVIDYSNFNEEVFPADFNFSTGEVKLEGVVNFHHCPYKCHHFDY